MNDTSANSIFVALLFILRCFIPIAALFGVSYLLRKMGLVATEYPEPADDLRDEDGTLLPVSENEDSRPEIPEIDVNGNETIAQSKEALE